MLKKPTKQLLAQSFYELSASKNIDKITVQNITQNAGFSHPTFYNHFQDKYDLLNWIYRMVAIGLFEEYKREGFNWYELLNRGLGLFEKYRKFALNAFEHTSGADSFLNHAAKINASLAESYLAERQNVSQLDPETIGMIEINAYGTVYYIYQWLLGKIPVSRQQLVSIIADSIPEPLLKILNSEDHSL